MANLEKHIKPLMSDWEDADYSQVPTRSRSARVLGRYTKNRRALPLRRPQQAAAQPEPEPEVRPVLIELRMDPTPGNLARMEVRLERLNRELESSGTPVRLRMVS